jgi:glucuronate isomerase
MKKFMDEDFLLNSEAARMHTNHNYAAKMPVIDYHCHTIQQRSLKKSATVL